MDTRFTIRDYRPSDYRGVLTLWQATGLGGAHRGDNDRVIANTLELGGKLLVIEDTESQEIVGTSWMTFDGRRIGLHHFGILPRLQHTGLGKKLAQASLAFAKYKGYQIKLEVHRDNTNAIALYTKLGFTYLGDYDVYIIRNYDGLEF